MKRFVLVVALGFAGCCAADPVSESNYREVLTKIQSNLDTQIRPSLVNMKNTDLHSEAPQHTGTWWDAKILLIDSTAALASDVLAAGAHK